MRQVIVIAGSLEEGLRYPDACAILIL
jgi:hypothetical protein